MKKDTYKMVDGYEVHPLDITAKLMHLAGITDNETEQALIDAVYNLDTICQNNYNFDFYRVFYNTLAIITDKTAF